MLVALTIVGLPLSLGGLIAFALLLWVAFVYGSLVTGTWLLSTLDREGAWAALVTGVVVVALVGIVPFVGGLLRFLVLLVGIGAFFLAVRGARGDDEGGFVVGAADAESTAV